jgi:hypothetical protein
MSGDNVIDSSSLFAKKREEHEQSKAEPNETEKIQSILDGMTEVYENATPAVESAIQYLVQQLQLAGYKAADFTYEDYLLMRESMFSMVMRSRDLFHPLQVISHSFENMVKPDDNN